MPPNCWNWWKPMNILEGEIEAVKVAGLLDVGLETLTAEKFEISEVRTIFSAPNGFC